jgi:hypothetical protein
MTQVEKLLYTARTHTTGGREGASRNSDGWLGVKLSPPGAPGTSTAVAAVGIDAGSRRDHRDSDWSGPEVVRRPGKPRLRSRTQSRPSSGRERAMSRVPLNGGTQPCP